MKVRIITSILSSTLISLIVSSPLYAQEADLYNTAKAKLLSGERIFSHTIGSFDIERYCAEAPHYDFTWFEMQHSTMSWGEIERMINSCPHIGATPMIRVPDELESFDSKSNGCWSAWNHYADY